MTRRPPFPTQQLAILAICRLAEPISFASILAYNYPYVKDIRGTPEHAAFYAGLLVSAFALAEASTAVVWGTISDKVGRKPVVLSGLIGVALSSLIFGIAKNYWVALTARALGGFLNGNVAVMQTMVAEMVKCPEHEPLAYSMIPFMWFFGSIIGSSMGALLAHPALLWPALEGTLFDNFPYLLPNLVAAIWILTAVTLGAIFLRETRVVEGVEKEPSNENEQSSEETSPLLPDDSSKNHSNYAISPQNGSPDSSSEGAVAPSLETATATLDGTQLPAALPAEIDPDSSRLATAPQPRPRWNRNMMLLIVQLGLASYGQMVYGVLMPIHLVEPPSSGTPEGAFDWRGGFGLTVRQVGGVMSANGFIAIVVQGVLFAPFVSRVGTWKSFVWMTILSPLPYMAVPFITMAPRAHAMIPIYIDLFAQNFINIIIYPCLLILLKDATPSTSILGQVNGMAMTCASGARTIAPPLAGYIYGAGGSAAGWWSIAVVAIVSGLLIPTIRRPLAPAKVQGV